MADEPLENPDLSQHVEYLRGLAQIVTQQGLSKLEIESDGFKWTLKAATPNRVLVASAPAAPLSAPIASPSAAPGAAAPGAEKLTPVVSPMVGVFYRAPSPSDPNFVEVGDRVERGQTIGLVEAMKVFNEITAESAGVVAQIPAQAGALVETGQPLILLR